MLKWLADWLYPAQRAAAANEIAAPVAEAPLPVIGISGSNGDSASVRAMMTQIRDAGAIPLFLSNHALRDPLADLDKIDALVVMGGNDIDPARYGQKPHPKTVIDTDKAREQYEFTILAAAVQRKVPVLGVCRGMQAINVLLGGTLHQHVPDIAGNSILHAQQDAGIAPFCPVQLIHMEPGTRLAQYAEGIKSVYCSLQKPGGDGFVPPGYVPENSMHHQSADLLGVGLCVAARSEDGITEAIEPAPGSPFADQFLLGVQWHPEFGASPLGARIAHAVAGAAATYAKEHDRTHPTHEAVEESLKSSAPVMPRRMAQTQQNTAPALQSLTF